MTNGPGQQWVERVCPVCGGAGRKPWLRKGELQLVRCTNCSMVYLNPARQAYLSGDYYDAQGQEYYLSPAKLAGDYTPVRFERELRFFRRFCPSGSVLDVGCSSGAFLYQLLHTGSGQYNVLGTDVSKAPLEYARSRGVPVLEAGFVEHDFEGQRFDAICFWAVLEHLQQPGEFLRRAAGLLKPNGHCFVLVPNFESLATRLLRQKYRYIYEQHLNYFTRRTLRLLVRDWFVASAFEFTHFNPVVIWQDWRRGGREVPNEERAALLSRTTRLKASTWLRPVKWLYGCAEGALGRLQLADNLMVALSKRSP